MEKTASRKRFASMDGIAPKNAQARSSETAEAASRDVCAVKHPHEERNMKLPTHAAIMSPNGKILKRGVWCRTGNKKSTARNTNTFVDSKSAACKRHGAITAKKKTPTSASAAMAMTARISPMSSRSIVNERRKEDLLREHCSKIEE
ncbi:MAG: hypothetical protein L0Y72_13715 [Gemmataceae bacterium]|nr:hypothetical protein [Gemmataceae bacterium]